jgi:transposase-like protein
MLLWYADCMRKDKQTAMRLRLQGKSYTEIQRELGGISKSTLSLWFKDMLLSDAARERLEKRQQAKSTAGLLKRNKRQTAMAIQRKNNILGVSKDQIGLFSANELLLIGAALYWAEGYKKPKMKNGRELTSHPISFTNADPKMLNMFLRFMTEICEVPRKDITVGVRIFQHLNKEAVLHYWSETLSIPRSNFEKTYLGISKSSQGKRPFNRLPYGVVQIRLNSTNLFHKIMGWIEGMKDQC